MENKQYEICIDGLKYTVHVDNEGIVRSCVLSEWIDKAWLDLKQHYFALGLVKYARRVK